MSKIALDITGDGAIFDWYFEYLSAVDRIIWSVGGLCFPHSTSLCKIELSPLSASHLKVSNPTHSFGSLILMV